MKPAVMEDYLRWLLPGARSEYPPVILQDKHLKPVVLEDTWNLLSSQGFLEMLLKSSEFFQSSSRTALKSFHHRGLLVRRLTRCLQFPYLSLFFCCHGGFLEMARPNAMSQLSQSSSRTGLWKLLFWRIPACSYQILAHTKFSIKPTFCILSKKVATRFRICSGYPPG